MSSSGWYFSTEYDTRDRYLRSSGSFATAFKGSCLAAHEATSIIIALDMLVGTRVVGLAAIPDRADAMIVTSTLG